MERSTRRSAAVAGIAMFALGFWPTESSAACPGCCSSHGGITNSCSTSGRVICADGSVSPSCSCSSCGVSTTPTPTCKPTTEYSTAACPQGSTGTVTSARTYTCLTSTYGTWGAWHEVYNTCVADVSWTPSYGNVRLADGTPICAMVLANGQYMFSCDGTGAYDFDVPLNPDGEITLFAFADGFAPYRETVGPSVFPLRSRCRWRPSIAPTYW